VPDNTQKQAIFFLLFVVALALLVWTLAHVFLLVFGAALIAIGLNAAAVWLSTQASLSYRWTLALVLVLLVVLLVGGGYLFGTTIAADIRQIGVSIPQSLRQLENVPIAHDVIEALGAIDMSTLAQGAAPRALGLLTSIVGAVISAFVVLVGAVYLAFDPDTYRRGGVALAPREVQGDVETFLDNVGAKLRRWFLGQLVLMVIVGIMVGVTMAFLGVPAAPALGLFAGLVEFVPFFGPFVAATLGVLVAFSVDVTLALWALLAFVVIQQIENQLLVPFIQQRAVSVPPALTVFAVLAFGVLFGIPGAVLAMPLTVVAVVAVQVFYLKQSNATAGGS
jgi:predicted PurR-regulated permease PerM